MDGETDSITDEIRSRDGVYFLDRWEVAVLGVSGRGGKVARGASIIGDKTPTRRGRRCRFAIYPPSLEIPHGLLAWISAAPILHTRTHLPQTYTSHTYIHRSFLVLLVEIHLIYGA